MTHKLNSSNNPVLKQLDTDLTKIINDLNAGWENLFKITIDEYPEIYHIRGIFGNFEPILREVRKAVQGGYCDTTYFQEKYEKFMHDLEELSKIHRENISVHFSTKVEEVK